MKFKEFRGIFVTRFDESGWSLGFHISQSINRFDLHFHVWVISFGKVPIYETKEKDGIRFVAVSEYYHKKTEEYRLKRSVLGI